jgi:alpha-L-fucosidase 2
LNEQGKAKVVERGIDLDKGISFVHSKSGDVNYYRECFASFDYQVIVFNYHADEKVSIDCSFNCSPVRSEVSCDENTLFYKVKTVDDAVEYVVGIRCVASGTNLNMMSNHIIAENAANVTVFISIETSFYEDNAFEKVKERLDCAVETGYENIRKKHIEDYMRLADRCSLKLGEDDDYVDVDTMVNKFKDGDKDSTLKLINTYFKFGRYLLISSSRDGSLPANLQGIWNNDFTPAWGSKFTININAEMNYWPAERLNLSDCH